MCAVLRFTKEYIIKISQISAQWLLCVWRKIYKGIYNKDIPNLCVVAYIYVVLRFTKEYIIKISQISVRSGFYVCGVKIYKRIYNKDIPNLCTVAFICVVLRFTKEYIIKISQICA